MERRESMTWKIPCPWCGTAVEAEKGPEPGRDNGFFDLDGYYVVEKEGMVWVEIPHHQNSRSEGRCIAAGEFAYVDDADAG